MLIPSVKIHSYPSEAILAHIHSYMALILIQVINDTHSYTSGTHSHTRDTDTHSHTRGTHSYTSDIGIRPDATVVMGPSCPTKCCLS